MITKSGVIGSVLRCSKHIIHSLFGKCETECFCALSVYFVLGVHIVLFVPHSSFVYLRITRDFIFFFFFFFFSFLFLFFFFFFFFFFFYHIKAGTHYFFFVVCIP